MPDLSSLLINTETATQQAPANTAGASAVSSPFADIINAYTPNRTANFITSNTGLINDIRDPKNYGDYDVSLNRFDTYEELDKERAENQKTIEQFNRALGQIGVDATLGTIQGFFDIADGVGQLIGLSDNDYTNDASEVISNLREQAREALEIYQEDPNAAFGFDSGWVMNGLVSVGSTLSLMIPGLGVSRGIGAIGRGIGAVTGRSLSRGIGKMLAKGAAKAKGLSIADAPINRYSKLTNAGIDQIRTALGMRVAENYMEARDTWETSKQETLDFLNNATNAQLDDFYKRNPELQGKSNEEIAEYLAGKSADQTFANDMWLLAFDVWQLRQLRNVFRATPQMRASTALNLENRNALNRMVGREAEKLTTGQKMRSLVSADGLKTIGAELSEGVEEGWQYMSQQRALDNTRKTLDDSYSTRRYEDFLTDAHMWDSAFWGWIGGIGFQGIAGATGRAWNRWIAKRKDTTDEARKAEINSRSATIQDSVNRIQLLDQNLDPDKPIRDKQGNIIPDGGFEEIDDITRDAKKAVEVNRLKTNLVIAAADAGNYDLLKKWFQSDEMKDFVNNNAAFEGTDSAKILSDMDKIYETYTNEINKIYNNDVTNEGIVKQIAKENTYAKLAIEEENRLENQYTTNINARINDLQDDVVKNEASVLIGEIEYHNEAVEINNITKSLEALEEAKNKKKITNLEYNYQKNKLERQRDLFVKRAGFDNYAAYNADTNQHKEYESVLRSLDDIDKELTDWAINRGMAQKRKALIQSQISDTNENIRNRAKLMEEQFELMRSEKYTNAMNEFERILDTNDIDEVDAYISKNKKAEESPLSDETKSKLDDIRKTLKLTTNDEDIFSNDLGFLMRRKRREKLNKPAAINNDEPASKAPDVASQAPQSPDDGTAQDTSSTGGKPQDASSQGTNTQGTNNTNKSDTKSDTPLGGPEADREMSPDEAQRKAIQKEIEEERKNSADNKLISDTVRLAIFNDKIDELSGIRNNSLEEQLSSFKDYLLGKGVSEELIDSNLPALVRSFNLVYNAKRSIDNGAQSSLSGIAAELLTDEQIDRREKIKELIRKYIETNKGFRFKDNKGNDVYAINYIALMDNIIKEFSKDNNDALTIDIVKELHDILGQELNKGIDGIRLLDKINTKVNVEKLQDLLDKRNVPDIEQNNNIGLPGTITDDIVAALNQLTPGSRLTIDTTPYGIRLWAHGERTNIQVGYNRKAKRTPTNNGFIAFSQVYIGGKAYNLFYNIEKSTDNGVNYYDSNLDEIFEGLNPEDGNLSNEYKELINIMTAYAENKIDADILNDFAQSKLGKKIIDSFIESGSKPIYNGQMMAACINYINRIYFYTDNTDNATDGYISYKNFLAKQYSNFEMTETLYNEAKKDPAGLNITVDYISRGTLLSNSETPLSKPSEVIANYKAGDISLGIVESDNIVEDSKTGTKRAVRGFKRRTLSVILPNGTNAPSYVPIIANGINKEKGIGKTLFDVVKTAIRQKQEGTISFEELSNILNRVFGHKNFINGVNCAIIDNQIIISTKNGKKPAIVIYKYKKGSSDLGTGMYLNPQENAEYETTNNTTFIGYNNADSALDAALTTVFNEAIFSLSYPMARGESSNPYYQQFLKDYNAVDYLDLIDKADMGRIRLEKQVLNNGVETNFATSAAPTKSNTQLRIRWQRSSPVGNETDTDDIAARLINKAKNANRINTSTFFKELGVNFNIGNDAIVKIFPQSFRYDADFNSHDDTKDAYAEFRPGQGTRVGEKFFLLFRNKRYGIREAQRVLIHEKIHSRFYELGGFGNLTNIVNEIREIRNEFANIVNGQIPESLERYIKEKGLDRVEYINQLKDFVDYSGNNGNEYYKSIANNEIAQLEEFVAEALTNPILANALNNIESKGYVINEQPTNLWTRIINWIRKLFGLGDIKNNTLMARTYLAFANENGNENADGTKKTKKTDADTQKTIDSKQLEFEFNASEETGDAPKDANSSRPTNSDEDTPTPINSDDGMFDDSITLDDDVAMSTLSGIEPVITVPSINALDQQLNASEQARMASLLATGAINWYCQ